MALRIKPGVDLTGLRPEMVLAAVAINDIYKEEFDKDCTITSGRDGTHSKNSLHYKGLALDFRTYILTRPQQALLKELAAVRLGSQYDVVLESDHLHCEFDP